MSSSGHPEDLAGGKGGLELLQADLAELENSIQHLIRSNNELSKYLEQTPGDSDFEEALKENEVVVLKKQARSDDLRQAIAELQGCLPQSFLKLSPINNDMGGPSTGPASTPGFPAVASISTDGAPALHLYQTRLEGGHPVPGIRMNMTGPQERISDSAVQGNMDMAQGHGRPLRQEQVTSTSGAFVRNDRGTASGGDSGLLL